MAVSNLFNNLITPPVILLRGRTGFFRLIFPKDHSPIFHDFLVDFGGKMERAQVVGPCPEKSFGSHIVPYEGFDVALEGLALILRLLFGVFNKLLF